MGETRRVHGKPGRKLLSGVAALALVAMSLTIGSLAAPTAASAAGQNGYVFNDAWKLENPGSAATQYTLPNARAVATYAATSSLPLRTGAVGVRLQMQDGPESVPGTSYLDGTDTQARWNATKDTFIGSPTPGNIPALAVETIGSNCAPYDSREKENYNGVCANTSTVTFTFDRMVTDPILDVSGIGGYVYRAVNGYSRGGFLQQRWSVTTPDVTLEAPAGTTPSNLAITSTGFGSGSRNIGANCYGAGQSDAGAAYASPKYDAAACGSVQLRGTFDTVTFQIDSDVAPFSAFPRATFGTGAQYFANGPDTNFADGVNGYNLLYGETGRLPNNTWDVQMDQAHFSLRLPQNGVIGDRVWNDTDGNGIQDSGEPGLAGVTVELLDADGNPVLDANGNPIKTVTDASGNYRFTDLPYGDYQVRFTGPDGYAPTQQGAGDDRATDSDIDASGVTGSITVNTDAPERTDIDAGFTANPKAENDESLDNKIGDPVTVPALKNDSGDLDPSTVKITNPDGDPVEELVVPGEGTWKVDPDTGDITFTPEEGFTKNPTPIDYTVKDTKGKQTGATVTVTYLPEASDDSSLNNAPGSTVTVPALKNDSGDLDPSTVKITNPDGDPVEELVVPGEGTWKVDPDTGDITFTPEEGFTKNPTPIDYTVKDTKGKQTGATVTVTYLPEAADDRSDHNVIGDAVTVPVLNNDGGELDPSTVKITGPLGNPVDELVVPGEGTWKVDPITGGITFTPEEGFTKNPTPIDYTVKDTNGNETGAKVTVTYDPKAADDRSDHHTIGDAVTVPTLKNDQGDLDPSTVKITNPDGDPVEELVVPGEGTWKVDPDTGDITFTPEEGFTKNPTPIDYTVKDTNGNETGAKVTVTYDPKAADDRSDHHTIGDAVTVPTLKNDQGDLDPSTVKITNPDGDPVEELVVPGEGTWKVDPDTGDITFTPEEGFTKNPTPIDYTVKDTNGNETGAKATITYQPEAANDESLNNPQGSTVTVPVLDNDTGDLDPGTVKIIDPKSGDPVGKLVVPGEGTWKVDPDTGDITFTPEKGFTGNPTPIDYLVKDRNGKQANAKVTVTYLPEAADDRSDHNTIGKSVTVPVLDNDRGDLDPGTVKIIDPKSGDPVGELVVPGEGTWKVNPKTGDITFTPEKGFTKNPTPIDYTVKDRNGNETRATVTVTYEPVGPSSPTNPKDPDPVHKNPEGPLATTGSDPAVLGSALGAAAVLVALGAGLAWFARRRKRAD